MICLFPVLSAIFVILRTYSRYLNRNFGWDDYLIFFAMLLLTGQTLTVYKCRSPQERRSACANWHRCTS